VNSDEVISEVDKYVLGTYKRIPLAIKRGKGCWVWDSEGKKLLDFTTGIAVTNLGHSHPALLGAIASQSREIIHGSNLFYMEPQAKLARNLVENSVCDKVFFCNTGTEAVEGAIKFARKWGTLNGKKHNIVSMHGSFHGRTYGALSATGSKQYHAGFEPMLEGFEFVPYGETDHIRRCLKGDKFCAVIVEPVQGEKFPARQVLQGGKDGPGAERRRLAPVRRYGRLESMESKNGGANPDRQRRVVRRATGSIDSAGPLHGFFRR